MKKFILVMPGEDADDTGVLFVNAENEEGALIYFLEEHQDFTLDDEDEAEMVRHLLEEYPVGIAEVTESNPNPSLEWFYELPE
jgi:hypothetical protein